MRKLNLEGKRFGRWIVLDFAGRNSVGKRAWKCRCQCGEQSIVTVGDLRSGKSKSCGCLRDESIISRSFVHGGCKTTEYICWHGLKDRCNNKNNRYFHIYGGRGIKVCERWSHFKNFLSDMGPRPPGTSIDRYPNKDGNYEPGNCRWATPAQQARNTSQNRWLEAYGLKYTITDWSKKLGISAFSIDYRLKRGVDMEAIVRGTL